MKKTIIIVLFGLLCPILIQSSSLSETPNVNLHLQCIYPAIKVLAEGGSGSGVILYSKKINGEYLNLAVTCGHVTETDINPTVVVIKYKNWSELESYENFDARIYYVDYDLDLCLLIFKTPYALNKATIKFDEKFFIGNSVYGIGFGDGTVIPRVDYGNITAVGAAFFHGLVYRAAVTTLSGDSGSGMYSHNNLFAIRYAVISKQGNALDHDALAIPIEFLRDMSGDVGGFDFIWDESLKNVPDLESIMLTVPDIRDLDAAQVPPPA